MKKIIHINQHVIKRNSKTGERNPVITCKTYKSNEYGHDVIVLGPCKIKYSPDKPLSCGAKVWIETHSEVIVIQEMTMSNKNNDTLYETLYEKHLEKMLAIHKDVDKAELEAETLTEKEMEND